MLAISIPLIFAFLIVVFALLGVIGSKFQGACMIVILILSIFLTLILAVGSF